MKILVAGSGGREHAIIKKLAEDPRVTKLWAAPGNGGIAADAECVPIKATDIDGIVSFAKSERPDLVVVAPDDPLVMGLVDRLADIGIQAFGPDKAAARIEGSKAFSKALMEKYGIPTARHAVFTSVAPAMEYIKNEGKYPVVVKADGLALGKGVVICENEREAEDALASMLNDGRFGKSGETVVVEEFLTGPEVSVLSFTDGETVIPMVSSMDHKRALTGDKGLNTGGMGAVAPNPYYTADIADKCMETIFIPTIRAMKAEGCPFRGCLYFGLMLTPDGPKVIEYNCRFGDPETQVVLPLMQTSLLSAMLACINGTLADEDVRFADDSAACIVLASGGYPVKYDTGFEINGLDDSILKESGALVYHAGTKLSDGKIVTSGGRVIGVTAVSGTLSEAINKAYAASDRISFNGLHKRTDIGQRALAAGAR